MNSAPSLGIYSIGLKLRTLRNERCLSLSRLGSLTGFSTALLSKLETDRMVPTLQTLAKICAVYGVGLDYFFTLPQRQTISITRKAHLSQSLRGPEAIKRTPLHCPDLSAKLIAYLVEIPPGASSRTDSSGIGTESTIYVIEGTLHLNFAGSEEAVEAGDVVVLNTDGIVLWGTPTDSARCRALIVEPQR